MTTFMEWRCFLSLLILLAALHVGHGHGKTQCDVLSKHSPLVSSLAKFRRPIINTRPVQDSLSIQGNQTKCNCSRAQLCQALKTGARQEVLVWYVQGDGNTWQRYDWTKVTTVAVLQDINTPVDQDLVCFAHAHNVRVVWTWQKGCWDSLDECDFIANSTIRHQIVDSLLVKIANEALDGVNVDIEGLTNNMVGMTAFTSELTQRVRQQCRNCTISVDLSAIPQDVFGFTGYNWTALSEIADFVITMNYDMCDYGPHGGFARANSPLPYVEQIEKCVMQGAWNQRVAPHRLVMGFPWYAYYFQCELLSPSPGECYSNASFNKAASQHSLADAILNQLPQSHGGRQWDNRTLSPYFDVIKNSKRYQVQYDDEESIRLKCLGAKSLGVRGVAFWTGSVEYGTQLPAEHYQLEQKMWDAVVWPGNSTSAQLREQGAP